MNKKAFTLAEVLITLGVIGIVAALTLPTLMQNLNKKIRAEQIRTVKYKFTKATDKMNSLGLIGPYDSTAAFVGELQKHLKIAKVCTASNLRSCWPYDKVILQDGKEYEISKVQTGKQFKMDTNESSDYTSPNVGIVTADGTPMILSYNQKCAALDPVKSYTWSTEDGKPVSNATANCVAAVFEINGTKKPNKLSDDVVLFNANGLGNSCAIELGGKCFTAPFTPTPMTKAECDAAISEGNLGISGCFFDNDYWAGAVKQCGGTKNMPSTDDIAKLASAIYEGNPNIPSTGKVEGLTYKNGTASSIGLPEPKFSLWTGAAYSPGGAYARDFDRNYTYSSAEWGANSNKNQGTIQALCISN